MLNSLMIIVWYLQLLFDVGVREMLGEQCSLNMLGRVEHVGTSWTCWDELNMLGQVEHVGTSWTCWDELNMLCKNRFETEAPSVGHQQQLLLNTNSGLNTNSVLNWVVHSQGWIKCCSAEATLQAEQGPCEPSKGFVSKERAEQRSRES